ncbi:MAG: hypothetical protein J6W52_04790 [Bacteroidaceae bacterium]|nr:hypothetical protein [Bacteroidaceae bacterium]
MNRLNAFVLLVTLMTSPSLMFGQVKDAFNGTRQNVGGSNVSAFNQNRVNNFNDYRQKLNAEYVSKTREKWRDFNSFRGLALPDKDVKPVNPINMSDDDAFRKKQDRNISIEGIVCPIKDNRQAQPIAPVQEVPENNSQHFSFSYFGTSLQVRRPQGGGFTLGSTEENAVADAWSQLCEPRFNNLVIDCIKLRSSLNLCDWAYLMLLQTLGNSYCGEGTNEATLLMAYIFSQSGYKMRLGQADGKLAMLYASRHNVYNTPYFDCDGEKFYAMSKSVGSIKINAAKYPREQSLSLWVGNDPQVYYSGTPTRTLVSKRYPEMSVNVSVNKNLLTFFSSYPTSEVGGNFMTRWAMYANTPICKEAQNELYPQLRQYISGRSELDAVERLLNWVQTAFVYEYDNKVWGSDRAFFPDETLYYPYCDCEDRSILFTRLVRDLLGLRCILIYYPGHLASAVSFTDNVNGDYINVNGRRYVVCDPTYIGASVGHTMPKMDNATANVIILE